MTDILLGIDESEQRAIALAETVTSLFEAGDVRAHLLHDFLKNPEGASVIQVAAVTRAAEILEDHGIEVEYHEGSGNPADSIIKTAEELDAEAICVAGRKRSPTGKMLFGSVSQEVILGTERPVFVCSAADDD